MSVLLTHLPFLENVCLEDFSGEFPAFTVCGQRVLRPEGSGEVFLRGSAGYSSSSAQMGPLLRGEGSSSYLVPRQASPKMENALPRHLD